MSELKTEYRGITIRFRELDESWECELTPDVWKSKQTLAQAKKAIDDFLKAESEYTAKPAIIIGETWRGGRLGTVVTITSVTQEGEVWIRNNGRREKVGKEYRVKLAKATPENEERLKRIEAMKADIYAIEAQIREIIKSMERIFQ